MRSFQLIIFFVMIDDVRNGHLLIKASLIDSILGEVRLNNMHLAEMTTAQTIVANTTLLLVV